MALSHNNETNLKTIDYQPHPFHMVSPSPWPVLTSISLLTLTSSGALTMHVFENLSTVFFISLFMVAYSMALWFRDVIAEGTYLGNHTLAVQRGINLGVALFIISEVFFFPCYFLSFFS